MPHRDSEYSELCDDCGARTGGGCLRCGLPLCADHLPADDERCSECERGFHMQRYRDRNRMGLGSELWLSLGAIGVAAAGGIVGITFAMPILGVLLSVGGLLGTLYVGINVTERRAARVARKTFLAQRPQHLLTGRVDRDADPTDD